MASPTKFSHVVYNTNRLAEMREWYRTVLGARVVFENDRLCFLTYDDEHHRVALADFGPLKPRASDAAGVNHVAYTFRSLGDLLDTYEWLRAAGIQPYRTINHGPTTSMYYRDPDGNQVELQVDNFPVAEGIAWMQGPAFARNPIGVEFDPDELVKKFKSGVPVAALVARGD